MEIPHRHLDILTTLFFYPLQDSPLYTTPQLHTLEILLGDQSDGRMDTLDVLDRLYEASRTIRRIVETRKNTPGFAPIRTLEVDEHLIYPAEESWLRANVQDFVLVQE